MREVISKKALEVVAEKGKNVELAPAQDAVLCLSPFMSNVKVRRIFCTLDSVGLLGKVT